MHSGREVTLEDIKFEQACVLYNIGSLHSVLGAMDTRQSADVSLGEMGSGWVRGGYSTSEVQDIKFEQALALYNMSLVTRKPVFRGFDQVRHKPACAATEAS